MTGRRHYKKRSGKSRRTRKMQGGLFLSRAACVKRLNKTKALRQLSGKSGILGRVRHSMHKGLCGWLYRGEKKVINNEIAKTTAQLKTVSPKTEKEARDIQTGLITVNNVKRSISDGPIQRSFSRTIAQDVQKRSGHGTSSNRPTSRSIVKSPKPTRSSPPSSKSIRDKSTPSDVSSFKFWGPSDHRPTDATTKATQTSTPNRSPIKRATPTYSKPASSNRTHAATPSVASTTMTKPRVKAKSKGKLPLYPRGFDSHVKRIVKGHDKYTKPYAF